MGFKAGIEIARCGRCKSLYDLNLPEQTVLYEDHYLGKILSDLVRRRSREIVASFEEYKKTGLLLDVGCGAGAILGAAVEAGWSAQGLEIASSAVDELRRQGFEVNKSFLEEAGYSDSSFDVVVANGVVEHVHDPAPFVAECFRILRPGGLFYVTTPNAFGCSARLLGLRWTTVEPGDHVHIFSLSGLSTLLGSHGFLIDRVTAEGVNPLEILYALRRRGLPADFDRSASSHQLNEAFSTSRARRFVKKQINLALTATRMGDELKVHATK